MAILAIIRTAHSRAGEPRIDQRFSRTTSYSTAKRRPVRVLGGVAALPNKQVQTARMY